MANDISKVAAKAAFAGLMCGALAACRSESPPPGPTAEPVPTSKANGEAAPTMPVAAAAPSGGKQCCKGLNACKGKGGCATDKHSCAGKNDCKGQGGCSMHCPK